MDKSDGAIVGQVEVTENQDGSDITLKYLSKKKFLKRIALGTEIKLSNMKLAYIRSDELSNQEFNPAHNVLIFKNQNVLDIDKNYRAACTGSFYNEAESILYCVNLEGKVYKYSSKEASDPLVVLNSQNISTKKQVSKISLISKSISTDGIKDGPVSLDISFTLDTKIEELRSVP